MGNKLDSFFMFLAKLMAVFMVIWFLYAIGLFDSILGREEFYRDYHNKKVETETTLNELKNM